MNPVVNLEIDDEQRVLAVDDGEESHAFDLVDDRELWYRSSDDTSATPPDEVVEELEARGYVVTIESGEGTPS